MERHHICEIVESNAVGSCYWRLRFVAPSIADKARAGQFVHVLPQALPHSNAPAFAPLLRRAFSILDRDRECVEILFRVGGLGTQTLAQLKAGDLLDVLGPLGKPFPVTTGDIVLVGGGVGVPPLSMLARQEAGGVASIRAIIGGRSSADILCVEAFQQSGVEPVIVTEDGSLGMQGLVTQPLKTILHNNFISKKPLETDCERTQIAVDISNSSAREEMFHVKQTVYACGPLPMLKAVAAICDEASVACIVSLEENMPCGIGVCNGCVVPSKKNEDTSQEPSSHEPSNNERDRSGHYEDYRRVCIDGPGMWAYEIDWAALCGK